MWHMHGPYGCPSGIVRVFTNDTIELIPDTIVQDMKRIDRERGPRGDVDLTLFVMCSPDDTRGRSLTVWPVISTNSSATYSHEVWGVTVTSSHLSNYQHVESIITALVESAILCVSAKKRWIVPIQDVIERQSEYDDVESDLGLLSLMRETQFTFHSFNDNFQADVQDRLLKSVKDAIASSVMEDWTGTPPTLECFMALFEGPIKAVLSTDEEVHPYPSILYGKGDTRVRIVYYHGDDQAICVPGHGIPRCDLHEDVIVVAPNVHPFPQPAFDTADPATTVKAWYTPDGFARVLACGIPLEHAAFVAPLIGARIAAARDLMHKKGFDVLQGKMEQLLGVPLTESDRWTHVPRDHPLSPCGYHDAACLRETFRRLSILLDKNLHSIKAKLWSPSSHLCRSHMAGELQRDVMGVVSVE